MLIVVTPENIKRQRPTEEGGNCYELALVEAGFTKAQVNRSATVLNVGERSVVIPTHGAIVNLLEYMNTGINVPIVSFVVDLPVDEAFASMAEELRARKAA